MAPGRTRSARKRLFTLRRRAAALRQGLLREGWICGGNLRGEEDECEIVPVRNRQLFHAVAVYVDDRRGLRGVEGRLLRVDAYCFLSPREGQLDEQMRIAPHGHCD